MVEIEGEQWEPLVTLDNSDGTESIWAVIRQIPSEFDDTQAEIVVSWIVSWNARGEPIELEKMFTAIIKWDGCSHVYLGDNGGYMHLCGKFYWDQLADVLRLAYAWATSRIKEYMPEVAE